MLTVTTRTLSATNTNGQRIVALAYGNFNTRRTVSSWDYSLTSPDNHADVAKAIAAEYGYTLLSMRVSVLEKMRVYTFNNAFGNQPEG